MAINPAGKPWLDDTYGVRIQEGDFIIRRSQPDEGYWYDEYLVVVMDWKYFTEGTGDKERYNLYMSTIRTGRQVQFPAKLPETWKNVNVTGLKLPSRKGGLLVYSEGPAL